MTASDAHEHGWPITAIDPPADPSERVGERYRSAVRSRRAAQRRAHVLGMMTKKPPRPLASSTRSELGSTSTSTEIAPLCSSRLSIHLFPSSRSSRLSGKQGPATTNPVAEPCRTPSIRFIRIPQPGKDRRLSTRSTAITGKPKFFTNKDSISANRTGTPSDRVANLTLAGDEKPGAGVNPDKLSITQRPASASMIDMGADCPLGIGYARADRSCRSWAGSTVSSSPG